MISKPQLEKNLIFTMRIAVVMVVYIDQQIPTRLTRQRQGGGCWEGNKT